MASCQFARGRARYAFFPYNSHLLRQLGPASRACVHDGRGRRAGPPPPPARRGRLLPDRHRRARRQGGAGRRRGRALAEGVLRPGVGALPRPGRAAGGVERLLHPHHRPASTSAGCRTSWCACATRGHLYEDTYSGLYCTRLRAFYAEDELDQPGNICPHPQAPGRAARGGEHVLPPLRVRRRSCSSCTTATPSSSCPRARYNEARSFIESGLADVSVSRATVSWGVPLPWEPEQTVYVWVDALLNYHTALEYGLGRDVTRDVLAASLHLIGKDILRLHGVIWPAMLMAAGYEPPRRLFVHGYFDQRRPEDVQVARQRDRPARGDRPARRRRAALLPAARGAVGPGRRASPARASTAATTASSPTTSATWCRGRRR